MPMTAEPATGKRYLCYTEVHELYGIGRDAITTLVRNRQLRRRMVGKAWRYPVADLEAIFSPDTRISHRRYKQ